MEFSTGTSLFHNELNGSGFTVKSDVTIATDGATSPVRMEMLKMPGFNFSQEYENYGYKELVIPAGTGGSFQLEKNALHIWPRGAFMLIALPNLDGSYTCTLFLANHNSLAGENSFEYLDSKEKVQVFFEKYFADASALIPGLTDEFFTNPTGSLITIKCYPWCVSGKSALLGDSAHAIVPFFGQGMNAAFEDCVYLNGLVEEHGNDWGVIFDRYQQMRKPNSDAIAELARENFIEMRDLVAQPRFQLKKKIESELYKKFPEIFVPKYTMVTFLRIPYEVALRRGKIQEKILDELTENTADFDKIDWKKAELLVTQNLIDLDSEK
jgi:kynurenine 3-monooxygenase